MGHVNRSGADDSNGHESGANDLKALVHEYTRKLVKRDLVEIALICRDPLCRVSLPAFDLIANARAVRSVLALTV